MSFCHRIIPSHRFPNLLLEDPVLALNRDRVAERSGKVPPHGNQKHIARRPASGGQSPAVFDCFIACCICAIICRITSPEPGARFSRHASKRFTCFSRFAY